MILKSKSGNILRQDLRQREYIIETQKKWGIRFGVSVRTMNRLIPKLIKEGAIRVVDSVGNNKKQKRINTYESLIYIQPYNEYSDLENITENQTSSELPCIERSKTSLLHSQLLLLSFNENGAEIGVRNRTIFACGLYLKWKNHGKITFKELYDSLLPGYLLSNLSEPEYMRTIRNILKEKYNHYFSSKKLIEWGIVENEDYSKYVYDMN